MAKINRYDGNVQAFAAESLSNERTVFGSETQDDTLDQNINADFLRGWGIVGVNENPTKQDFNAAFYTLGQLIAYLHQAGIPEWNAAQEMFEGSVVTTTAGIYRLKSGGDSTVDPDTDDGTNWDKAPTAQEYTRTFESVADLQASSAVVTGQFVRTLGYYAPGDGGGNDYEIVAAGTGSNYGFLFEQLTASGNEAKLLGGGIMEDKTAYIPSDYDTLQDAIDDLSKLRVTQGATIDLMIEAGHSPLSGLVCANGNYSHFKISSQDAVVSLPVGYVGSGFLHATDSFAPSLNCLVDLQGNAGFDSYLLNNSRGFITPGSGMVNGTRGLHASNTSHCVADFSVFTGFQQAGLHCSRTSTVQCADADFSGNSQDPDSSFGAVYASRSSRIHGPRINATNSGGDGIRAQRFAEITVPDIDISGATKIGIAAVLGGKVFCSTGPITANNMQGQAVSCQGGAIISIDGDFSADAGNGSDGVVVRTSSTFTCSGSLSGFGGIGVYALESSTVNYRAVAITGASVGVWCEQSAVINAHDASIVGGTTASRGVFARRGGTINITNGSVTGFSSINGDLAISNGGFITASGCTTTNGTGTPAIGDTNISSFNSISRDGYILTD